MVNVQRSEAVRVRQRLGLEECDSLQLEETVSSVTADDDSLSVS